MFKFSVVPKEKTVYQHIKDNSDWDSRVATVGDLYRPRQQVNGFAFDAEAIARELAQFYRYVGCVQWQSQVNSQICGATLTVNPHAAREDWLKGAFGHRRYQESDDYYRAVSEDTVNRVKGDYLDSLSFRRLHPDLYAYCPTLIALLARFTVPVVRVTARTILGHVCAPSTNQDNVGGFHIDDSPFEVLRVNMAIENNGNFGMEYEGRDLLLCRSGDHLVVNTDHRHRVHVKDFGLSARTHIVVGLAPWLHYDLRRDGWTFNDYAGRVHPYDMAEQGLLFKV